MLPVLARMSYCRLLLLLTCSRHINVLPLYPYPGHTGTGPRLPPVAGYKQETRGRSARQWSEAAAAEDGRQNKPLS